MKYNQLNTTATKNSTRVGRGISAGKGKTAGRGTKGQNARTGGGTRPGFEGGQNPLMQRLPKMRGFRSVRTADEIVYTGQLENCKANVDNTNLFEQGLVSGPYVSVKIVVKGELTKKRTVVLQKASKTAIEMIQKAGGTFTPVTRLQQQKSNKKDNK